MKKFVLFLLFCLVFIPFIFAEQLNFSNQINFAVCDNDGTCDSGEDKCTCSNDCGVCSGDVTNSSCEEYSCLTGLCRATIKYYCCGNHICESGEDFSNCDADCAPTEITIELLSPSDSNVFLRGEEITFQAKVKADGVTAKQANVRVRTFVGDIPMYDDGNHSDVKANDGIYGVSFLVSELITKNDYVSEIYAEKLGVSATHDFIVKVDPSLEMNFSIDKNIYVLGEIIHFEGILTKREKPLSTVITISAFNKGEKIFESKTRSDKNGFFEWDERTSLIYSQGNWGFEVSGLDVFQNEGLGKTTAIVSKEAGTIFMDVVFASDYDKLFNRGNEIKLLVDVLFDKKPIDDADVIALFPDGKQVDLKMVASGKYSLSYFLPFDFPLGEQTILINAEKKIGSIKYGGSNELKVTIDNAKINVFLLQPTKQTVVLGEELAFRIRLAYENAMPLTKAKILIRLNDKNIVATEKESGIFSFNYIVDTDDISESRQLLLNVQVSDAFDNTDSLNKLFEVTGELTLEYYFRENPLLFLSVIFAFVFIIIVIIVVRNRMNRLSALNNRKKQLEKLKGDLQDKYFNLGAIGNEQYYSLLSKYSSELRDIDSAIEAFKKASKEKGVKTEQNEDEDVFGKEKASFDDSELGSMFKVKKNQSYSDDEDVPALFALPKKNKEKKKAGKEPEEKESREEESEEKNKDENNAEEEDLWK
ncbi:MAG: hypothetical protein COT90_05810 [Candidatus Diapherotrites archaeon CG10_big_fil_rev_8_21_14_0_10_31_34]|nr:MAG: hypothetical protein COT90_05810 [Candidatus Diapherotrites archaeon CG10_big_fil_rev_8_21_14_0_10_31_34]